MRLTTLTVAYPLAPVGPDAAGGAEQIAAALDAALVEAGHRSLVIACEGSRVRGELIAIPAEPPPFDAAAKERAARAAAAAIQATLAREAVDVVHLHGVDFLDYLPPPGPPTLVTLHLPPAWYPQATFRIARPDTHLNPVSAAQRAACPAAANLLPEIPNGVDAEALQAPARPRRFALMLARICPEKGVHLGIDAARRAAVPLLIAGRAFPYAAHEAYFRRDVAPRLGRGARLLGPVGPAAKRRLLAGARCVLLPSLASETSSLVAMEALAAGAPVVAFANGALREIVEHGRTGFLVRDAAEMAEAIRRAEEIEPERCRRAARERFALDGMVARYFSVYRRLAAPIETWTSIEQLEARREEWLALWRRSPGATPFQTPEWQIAWARSFRPEGLRVLALRRAGRLAALLPLYVDAAGIARPLGVSLSDEFDLLGDPEAAQPLLARLAEDGVVRLDLPDLAPGSALANGGEGWSAEETPAAPRAGLPLPAAFSPGKRRKIQQARNRAERLGGFAIAWDEADALDALFALHEARWTAKGETGVLADPRVRGMHRLAVPGLREQGGLRLGVLRIAGRPAAAYYGFHAGRRSYAYLGGLAPDFAYASPGVLLMAEAIARATAEGAAWFDFLRGAEAYKLGWGARMRPGRTVVLRRAAC